MGKRVTVENPTVSREQLRKFLITARHCAHLNQSALAREWGVSRHSISRWEKALGPEIPPILWDALIGLLMRRGLVVQFLADGLPHVAAGMTPFRPVTRWNKRAS